MEFNNPFSLCVPISVFNVEDFAILSLDDSKKVPKEDEEKSRYTFVSGNLLLGVESVGKFQNMPNVYGRASKIAQSFSTINKNDTSGKFSVYDVSSCIIFRIYLIYVSE